MRFGIAGRGRLGTVAQPTRGHCTQPRHPSHTSPGGTGPIPGHTGQLPALPHRAWSGPVLGRPRHAHPVWHGVQQQPDPVSRRAGQLERRRLLPRAAPRPVTRWPLVVPGLSVQQHHAHHPRRQRCTVCLPAHRVARYPAQARPPDAVALQHASGHEGLARAVL